MSHQERVDLTSIILWLNNAPRVTSMRQGPQACISPTSILYFFVLHIMICESPKPIPTHCSNRKLILRNTILHVSFYHSNVNLSRFNACLLNNSTHKTLPYMLQPVCWLKVHDPNWHSKNDKLRVTVAIRTLHDCPSQMNENLLISNSKLTSDSELIWWR